MEQDSSKLSESFSGIRGVYGEGITIKLAQRYALAFCHLFCNKNSVLVIAGDSRASTPILKSEMEGAFSDFGVKKIINLGLVPVQVCQLAIIKFKADGGVYITASHNEPECNGWKFLGKDGAILYKEQTEKLIKLVHNFEQKNFKKSKNKTKILNKNRESINEYINLVFRKIGKKSSDKIKRSNFKILADPNGGSATAILKKLFSKLGVKADIINNKPGEFLRKIEPNTDSLSGLKDKIKNEYEFGCGFDCDADRVEFILPEDSKFAKESSQMVSGQYVFALACAACLPGSKNQIVVTNDCTSYLVRDIAKKYKAKIKEVEVGETNVVEEMEKQKSIIGGEGSNGGVIIPPIKCRDGIMATILILKLIAEKQKKLSDILLSYPKYYSEKTLKECSPEDANLMKKDLEKYFKQKKYKIKKTGDITGGLKILFNENCYLWFRESKTEYGKFRIIADGDDPKKVKEMLEEGSEIFDKLKNIN
ncbi:MAG: hypothetical protein ABSF55_01165 [Candidatus Staskawiczbacteria bacterium]|jgi:phosphomannomutase